MRISNIINPSVAESEGGLANQKSIIKFMKIKIKELKLLVKKVVGSKYYSEEEAEKITEVFVFAEIAGKNTQGIIKLMGPEPAQDIKPKHKARLIKKSNLSVLVDSGGSAGPLGAQIATDELVKIAKKEGFGITALNNTFSSIGALSFYANKVAKNDLIAIVAASSPKAVIHYGGIEPLYGTNPIAFGFPTEKYPILLDIASSAITWYGLVKAKTLGQKLPKNVAIDRSGKITLNPDEAMKGAILPFDRSYKGSGLAMTVELLAGVLSGASYVFDEGDWGSTFIAFSPDLLIGTENFKKNSSDLIQKVRRSKTVSGGKIHIPGYDTEAKMEELSRRGTIDIETKLIGKLRKLAEQAD